MKALHKVTGNLTVTKLFTDKRPNEVVIDQENVVTIGLASFLADIMMGDFPPGTLLQDVGLRWLQLGASSQDHYTTNYFYELSSPFSIDDYGDHTNLNLKNYHQVSAINPFYVPPTLTETVGTFIKLEDHRISKIADDKVLFTVLLDEHTLNGKEISEIGLFYNKAKKEETALLELGAYKAFGITDGCGESVPITKTKDFILQIEWVLSTNTGDSTTSTDLNPTEQGNGTDGCPVFNFYKASDSNAEGNALVCYFPNAFECNEPYTKHCATLGDKQNNIETRLFQRLLSKGVSIASFDYRFVDENNPSACRVFTSSVDDPSGMIPSSTSPLRLPHGIKNCYTDAVSSVQWAKQYGQQNWNINPSNVFTVGNGIGGSLASFVAYMSDCSSTPGVGIEDFETCSSRVLGTSIKSAPTDWSRWYPYTLNTFDFKIAVVPKTTKMSGPAWAPGWSNDNYAVTSTSTDSNYTTDKWVYPELSAIGDASSYFLEDSDMAKKPDGTPLGFFWSAIPDLKSHFQWRTIALNTKRFWSSAHQASSTSSVVDPENSNCYWGHPDNDTVYAHLSYAGSSLSGASWEEYASTNTFKLLDYSSNNYIDIGDVNEPVINSQFRIIAGEPLDYYGLSANTSSFSFALTDIPPGYWDFYNDTSALANDLRDEMQGKQLLEQLYGLGGTQNASSTFINYAPTTLTTPGSDFQLGSISSFVIWNLNMEEECARDRADWIVSILKEYDSWYDQY